MHTLRPTGTGGLELLDGDHLLATATLEPGERFRDLRVEVAGSTERSAALDAVVPSVAGDPSTPDGLPLRWWVTDPDESTDALADRVGLTERRDLLQLRRPLPLDEQARAGRPPLPTRPIRLGTDDEPAVVALNNRAFAWHPDQSGRTAAWLRDGAAEPWFDAEGFRLHEIDGELAGFCWTKVHHDHNPPIGEIYVIAVDPRVHSRGLGRGLTVAGLDHLASRDIRLAMLYVEALNLSALALYDRLGFECHQRTRAYQSASS